MMLQWRHCAKRALKISPTAGRRICRAVRLSAWPSPVPWSVHVGFCWPTEPTGALDSHTGLKILEVLRARADAGAAVLMVTHEPRYAAWSDRTVFIRDGRIVDETGPTDFDAMLESDDAVESGR